MNSQPNYITFLAPEGTTTQYYILDNAYNLQLTSIFDGQLKPLSINPGGLAELKISFAKNIELDGVNRIFGDPLNFIADGQQIIETKFYATAGVGIETRIRVLIFEYNSQPLPNEATYIKIVDMPMDMFKFKKSLNGNGFTVPLLDGGFMQTYNAFGKTEIAIPCDGSLSTNKRIYFDGYALEDTLNYRFIPCDISGQTAVVIPPTAFVNNESDNYNTVHNDTSYEVALGPGGQLDQVSIQTSPNYLFYRTEPTKVRMVGEIVVKPKNRNFCTIGMFLATDKTYTIGNEQIALINSVNDGFYTSIPIESSDYNHFYKTITQETIIKFDKTISLAAYEKLFPFFESVIQDATITGGSFQLIFQSAPSPTRCWGITLKDAMAYVIAEMNNASLAQGSTRVFDFQSALLDSKTNFILTSGAAIQASGNPDQGKYYRVFDINATPNSNLTSAYGPVIKISFIDLFQICKVYCFGGMKITGDKVEFVSKNDLWDSTSEPYDLGEATLESSVAVPEDAVLEDYHFTAVKVGAKAISFDTKSGKFDFNTTANYISTLLSGPLKYLDLSVNCCTSPFAFEQWRSGILQPNTSTTNNDNDNTICLVNVDLDANKQVADIAVISFQSTLPDFNSSVNTNLRLVSNESAQAVSATTINGSYFSLNNESSIMVFAEPNLNEAKFYKFHYDGYVTGLLANTVTGEAADFVKIEIVANGLLLDSTVYTIGDIGTAGPQLNIRFDRTLTRISRTNDSIYMRMSTSVNAGGQLDNVSIDVYETDETTPYWQADANTELTLINPGIPSVLIALPFVVPTYISYDGNTIATVNYGFQYYMFNSIIANSYFSYFLNINQITLGAVTENVSYNLYKNGLIINTKTVIGTTSQTAASQTSNFGPEQLNIGDIFFVNASMTNMQSQVTAMLLQFEVQGLLCSPPKRVEYDLFSGVPNVAINPITGKPSTAIAGAVYNIEELTWARIMYLWRSWIAGPLFDQANAIMQFLKADKNENLFTIYQGQTFKERNDIRRSDMGIPLISNRGVSFNTEVAIRFNQMYQNVVNRLVKFSIYGVPFLGYAITLDQSPTLNAAQKWQMMWSPRSDLSQLINLNYNSVKYLQMADRSIRINYTAPVMFVAQNRELPAGCHFFSIDQGLIIENLHRWFQKFDWFQPWQIGDIISLQNWVHGLSPTVVYFIRVEDGALLKSVTYSEVAVNGGPLNPDIKNMQVDLDTSDLPECIFYLKVTAAGDGGSVIISEPMELLADQPDTFKIKYANTFNAQGVPFITGYSPMIRARGNILNNAVVDLKVEFFTDDEQDVSLLGSTPFEGFVCDFDLMPDRMVKTFNRILGLNNNEIEGWGKVTRAVANGKLEKVFDEEGLALRSYKIQMQQAENSDGYDVVASQFVEDSFLTAAIQSGAWGSNFDNEAPGDDSQLTDFEIIT